MTTLPNKCRPGTFAEVVGNASTVQTIESKVQGKNPPHVYLITGPAGTGKTTMGYLIAKSLNGFDSHNFTELDSASYRGIDAVREVRKNSKFAPIGKSKNRCWLLDECHQLTSDAQEAFLKLLENPPKKAYFILCTTNPEKLKPTLKRRCSHFELSPIDDDTITQALINIAEKEGKEVPRKIIEEIIDRSMGSMGVALAHLDKIIDVPGKDMLGLIKNNDKIKTEGIDLCRALINKAKWKDVAGIIKGIDPSQYESVRRAVLGYSAAVLLKKDNARAFLIMDTFISPFYDSPREQLIHAAYECLYAE